MLDWVNVDIKETRYTFDFRQQFFKPIASLDAAHYTIKSIVKKNPPPYTLYLSGGVDSQAMLYAWITSGEKFQTFSAVYNNKSNWHDLETLDKFSKNHKIEINYVEFDLFKFLDTEHEHFVNSYICGSPQITTLMKLVSMNSSGTSIMSGNFIFKVLPSLKNRVDIDNNNFGLWHYAKKNNSNFIPYFFLETSELAYSFQYKNLNEKKDDYKHMSFYDLKTLLYQENGYPVIQQNKKYNGFERVKEYFDNDLSKIPNAIDKLLKAPMQTSNRKFDLLYRNKYEHKFINYKYNILC